MLNKCILTRHNGEKLDSYTIFTCIDDFFGSFSTTCACPFHFQGRFAPLASVKTTFYPSI